MKTVSLLCTVAATTLLLARIETAAVIMISPSGSPVVTEGGTINFAANIPVHWSLVPGSRGSINATTGAYSAPLAITAKATSQGCPTAPNDHIFNTRIDKLPVDPNSPTWMSQLPLLKLTYEQGWGTSTYADSTPAHAVTFNYTPRFNGNYQIPSWPNLRTEMGNYATGFGAHTDHHIAALNRSNCQYFEIYDYSPLTARTGTAAGGVKYSGLSYALPGGTDAAGIPLQPLTLKLAELESGRILHALRFSMPNKYIVPNHVWPATANAYPYSRTLFPYGTRFRLKASALGTAAGYPKMVQTLITQLLEYGLILTDGGPYVSISTDQDLKEDSQAISAISHVMAAVNAAGGMGAFEVVDESSLQADATGVVKLNNGYVTPEDSVQVIATELSNPSNTATTRIVLEGVGVGVPDAAVTVASGATVQLTAWTTGTHSNGATAWQATQSLAASGIYTAPKVNAVTRTTATVYSVENPAAKQTVAISVVPTGADGSLRFSDNMGPSYNFGYPGSTYVDTQGITWWPEPGFIASSYNYCDWGGAGGGLFNGWCNFGPDVTHNVLVPNGNYKITLYIGVRKSSSSRLASWNVGAQGQWAVTGLNPIAASADGTQPVTLSIPGQVTDNQLSFTVSNVLANGGGIGPALSGFAIDPDNTPPHLTISDENANTSSTNIVCNGTTQFSAIGWYMSNSVKWTISPQIGTVSSSGRYTAPATPQTGTITLTATSKSDPKQSASMIIHLIKGSLNLNAANNPLPRSMSTQMSVNLNGRAYSNVIWSADTGKISPAGLYTAPDLLAANSPVTITATSTDDPTLSATFALNLLANMNPIRHGCGDWYEPVTDAKGNVWATDYGADGGAVYHANSFVMSGQELDGQPLTDRSPMSPLYNESRYSAYTANNEFTYTHSVPNGEYQVTLLFGNYGSTAHNSLFNVIANRATVIRNYDPDRSGFHVGSTQTFNVDVTGGRLTLTFVGAHGKLAEVNGIQIVSLPMASTP